MKSIYPQSRQSKIIIQELKDEVLIYDLNTNKAMCLNLTSAAVWQACDGNRNVTEISRYLSKKLNQPISTEMVWITLDLLKKADLLMNKNEIVLDFNGLSRREIVQKIGLASLVALPTISSLVAPTVAQAASGAVCANPLEVSCTTNQQCINLGAGTSCLNNCCSFGIPGNVCTPSPTVVCPPTPPGCDPVFGC